MPGGDDCVLKGWDTRMGTSQTTFKSKRHSAGVCSIQSNPHKEHILATGSYDENIFIWDTRSMKSPLAEQNIGGGVWRIKWHPNDPLQVLTATMHNGFHAIKFNQDYSNTSEIRNYMDGEHGSLGYGADWNYHLKNKEGTHYKGTCSFYDHSFHIWC